MTKYKAQKGEDPDWDRKVVGFPRSVEALRPIRKLEEAQLCFVVEEEQEQ